MSGCSDLISRLNERVHELEVERDELRDRVLEKERERDEARSQRDDVKLELEQVMQTVGEFYEKRPLSI